MVRQVCFLICQGCQDDLQDGSSGFVRLAVQEHDLVAKLRQVLTSPHEDLKADDIRELVTHTIEK